MFERPYHPDDQSILTDLWLAHRLATNIKVYPTLWRYRLLLSSRVWDPQKDTRLWHSRDGDLLAFGMLWRRTPASPYLVLDLCHNPFTLKDTLFRTGLDWGLRRAREITTQTKTELTLFASTFDSITNQKHFTELGFAQIEPDHREHNLYFTRSLKGDIEKPILPRGYSIRSVQSRDEIEAYAAIYDFSAVNPQHLEELLASDEYDLRVIANTSGDFVAYCETSFCREEWQRSGQRLGWIDYIGTRPDDRRRGLGRAILLESLRHLQVQGAETALLVTVNTNGAAIGFYQNAGFEIFQITEPTSYQIILQSE